MRKLIESTFLTLDGVISDPQNWSPSYWDAEHAEYARALLFGADALLLGRETYEGFAQAWPSRAGADEYTDRINALPKHVASTTLKPEDMTWNASLLDGDAAEAVAALKNQPGQDILKFGTGVLDQTLLAHSLVDEYHFWAFPVIAGSGTRLLDGLDVTHLEHVRTTPFKSGIVVLTYTPKS